MKRKIETPFDSIENAQQYIKLLAETVAETKHDVDHEIAVATDQGSSRFQAVRLVEYNLAKLQRYLSGTSRTLNDLRSLRRLLLKERPAARSSAKEGPATSEIKEKPAVHDLKEKPATKDLQEKPAINSAKHRQAIRTRALTGTLSSEPLPIRRMPSIAIY